MTPKYGSSIGLNEFEKQGYNTTLVSELNDNSIGINAMKMLTRNKINKYTCYSVFLKRKRTGMVEAKRCTNDMLQRIYISKDEFSSLTVLTYALLILCVMDTIEKMICNIDLSYKKYNCLSLYWKHNKGIRDTPQSNTIL